MAWTRNQVKFLLSDQSTLSAQQREEMIGILQENPARGHMTEVQWEEVRKGLEGLEKAPKRKEFKESHKGTSRGTISNNIRYFMKKRKFPQGKAVAAAINIAEETAKKRGTKAQLRKAADSGPTLVLLAN